MREEIYEGWNTWGAFRGGNTWGGKYMSGNIHMREIYEGEIHMKSMWGGNTTLKLWLVLSSHPPHDKYHHDIVSKYCWYILIYFQPPDIVWKYPWYIFNLILSENIPDIFWFEPPDIVWKYSAPPHDWCYLSTQVSFRMNLPGMGPITYVLQNTVWKYKPGRIIGDFQSNRYQT